MEIIKTDILVIGGGGAGMRAALAAREKGAEVLLVSKTPMGKSTCTYLSAGAFTLAVGGLSTEAHLALTLQTGKGVNVNELVEILVNETPERVRELEQFGLVGEWQKGRYRCLGRPTAAGAPLANILAETAMKQGVSSLPWVIVTELVTESGKIVGAVGFDFRKGKAIAFLSKAVILASGGGGALYLRHDNPVRATGDGYALAFHAGCPLRDMEFVQFIPVGLAEPGKPALLIAPPLADMGRITNSLGEDILKKYQITEKPVAVRSRDSFSLAIFKEEMEGREVFIDLRSLSEKDWLQNSLVRAQRDMLMKYLAGSVKPLRIYPMCHFFMGGVSTDQDGRTGVVGLYAAGETVGGLHGANRMGGNALSETQVFGYRAGKTAGAWVIEQDWAKGAHDLLNGRLNSFQKKWVPSAADLPPRLIRKKIGEILWREGGILREESGLSSALGALKRMKQEDLPRAKTESPKEILEKMEVENALLVAEMVLQSALMREESRGVHFRKDFPHPDDQKWKGNIFLRKRGEGMKLEFRPLPKIIS
ncbi:MAG: FAD-binding protein [Proteobacteria bacterium]|nr:FAD-binding protein [Pseudomonadota bacterium]